MFSPLSLNDTASSASDEQAPPKPPRIERPPILGEVQQQQAMTTTYIVAQNPEILTQLMRESEQRGLNPSAYSTPASAFNTIAVDFIGGTGTLGSPKRKLKTKLFSNLSVDHHRTGERDGGTALNNQQQFLLTDTGAASNVMLNQHNCSTLSSLGTMSTSSSNLSSSTPGGSKPTSNYGTLDKVAAFDDLYFFLS